jgi:hypothetical protein
MFILQEVCVGAVLAALAAGVVLHLGAHRYLQQQTSPRPIDTTQAHAVLFGADTLRHAASTRHQHSRNLAGPLPRPICPANKIVLLTGDDVTIEVIPTGPQHGAIASTVD